MQREESSTSSSNVACPGAGACAGQASPRTRWQWRSTASASAALGDSLVPADERETRADAAARAVRRARRTARPAGARRFVYSAWAAQCDGRHRRERRLDERRAPLARDRTGGGHGALARTTSPVSARRTPVLASLAPGGRCDGRGLPPGRRHRRADPRARAGRPHRRLGADGRRPDARRGDGGRARAGRRGRAHPASSRSSRAGRSTRCAATSRPREASSSSPARSAAPTRGPARVFDTEEACTDAVRAGHVQAGDVLVVRYEGPAGGPGHARAAERDLVGGRRRARRVGRARHRRPLLGRDARADGRPRRPRGGARRPARDRARRRLDHDRHRRRARSRSSWTTPRSPSASPRGSRRRCATAAASSPATALSSAPPPRAPSSSPTRRDRLSLRRTAAQAAPRHRRR